MKPRCEIHNAPLRWVRQFKAWVCFAGVRDGRSQDLGFRIRETGKTCQPYHREFPRPFKPFVIKQTRWSFDGRELLSPSDYAKRCVEVWERDGRRCQAEVMVSSGDGGVRFEKCGAYLALRSQAEIHHLRGRGMGGGSRDDRMENLSTRCKPCHRAAAPGWNGMTLAGMAYGPGGDKGFKDQGFRI